MWLSDFHKTTRCRDFLFPIVYTYLLSQRLIGCRLLFSCPVVWHSTLCYRMDCSMRLPFLSPSPKVFPSSCPLYQWCHPAISSSDALFSFYPQSFPASGTFPVSQLFASDDQNTEALASASILPMSIQGWFPLRLTVLIRLLTGVFSSTTVQRHQLFGVLPSLWSSSHNHSWPPGRPQPWHTHIYSHPWWLRQ